MQTEIYDFPAKPGRNYRWVVYDKGPYSIRVKLMKVNSRLFGLRKVYEECFRTNVELTDYFWRYDLTELGEIVSKGVRRAYAQYQDKLIKEAVKDEFRDKSFGSF